LYLGELAQYTTYKSLRVVNPHASRRL